MTDGAAVSKAFDTVEMGPPVVTGVGSWTGAPPGPADSEGSPPPDPPPPGETLVAVAVGGAGIFAGAVGQDLALGTVVYALHPTVGVPDRVIGSKGPTIPPQLQ